MADLSCVDVGHGGAGNVTFIVGDALGDALMRTGGVVVRLVFGQDRVQMPAAEDQQAWRRNTAFSCRSTSSSASFAGSVRNTRTARPRTRRASRYTILSGARPANHDGAEHADDSAGQPLNRLLERHRVSGMVFNGRWL